MGSMQWSGWRQYQTSGKACAAYQYAVKSWVLPSNYDGAVEKRDVQNNAEKQLPFGGWLVAPEKRSPASNGGEAIDNNVNTWLLFDAWGVQAKQIN